MSFRHLEAQAVPKSKTVPLVLDQLRGNPVLHVEWLGDTNIEFWNDAIAKANAQAGMSGGGKRKISDAMIRENRLKNRDIVATHSVRKLENIKHDDGTLAGLEDIRDVVFSLPDDVFDSVWSFVNNPNNFREEIFENPAEVAKK